MCGTVVVAAPRSARWDCLLQRNLGDVEGRARWAVWVARSTSPLFSTATLGQLKAVPWVLHSAGRLGRGRVLELVSLVPG